MNKIKRKVIKDFKRLLKTYNDIEMINLDNDIIFKILSRTLYYVKVNKGSDDNE